MWGLHGYEKRNGVFVWTGFVRNACESPLVAHVRVLQVHVKVRCEGYGRQRKWRTHASIHTRQKQNVLLRTTEQILCNENATAIALAAR